MKSALKSLVLALMGRYFRREVIHFVAVVILLMTATSLLVMFAASGRRGTKIGPALGADYAGFYMAGTLLNNFSSDQLYDLRLQDRLFHQVQPEAPPGEVLTYVHAPFVAPLFQPLARLPYAPSFMAWLVISVTLSLAGIGLTLKTASAIPALDRPTAWLLAVSFEPLVNECWLGGQASGFGLFWLALALACERRGRPFTAGLALGVLGYKPTLLTLILPMLVVGRRWRTLGGLALGATALAGLSLAVVGWHGFKSYIDLLLYYSRTVSGDRMIFRTQKYVDILSFFKLILGVASPAARALAVALTIPALVFLAAIWAGAIRGGRDRRELAFATTLTWTPILNPYGAVYDTVLVVPGLILTADILYRRSPPARPALPIAFQGFLGLLYLAALLSPFFAFAFGFQPLTLALASMGTYQGRLCLRD
jgi:hypothetical protein